MSLHRSPALTLIYNEIKSSQRNRILDLGAMTSANFSFFSQLSCKLQVEDLSDFVIETINNNQLDNLNRIDEYLIDYQENEKFDVIFLWDLLNYLSLEGIKKLMSKLSQYSRPDTLFYTVRYLEKKIPKIPQTFHIQDQYYMRIDTKPLDNRLFEATSTVQLLKAIPDYRMQNTLMNKKGMQTGSIEHILRYMPGQNFKTPQVSKVECDKSQLSKHVKTITHTSPALKMACNHLRRKKTGNILIVGQSISKNTDFFVERCAGVYNVDLFPYIHWQKNESTNRAISDASLNLEPGIRFDVILTWDLFNFCNLEQILQTNQLLARHANQDSLLISHVYRHNAIPERPQQFYITDRDNVEISDSEHPPAKGIDLTCGTLFKKLNDFDMDTSFYYRQGMSSGITEYIFKPKIIEQRSA